MLQLHREYGGTLLWGGWGFGDDEVDEKKILRVWPWGCYSLLVRKRECSHEIEGRRAAEGHSLFYVDNGIVC